ncbi:MAG TPA: hypothetical protein VD866_33160 [Urbifossiella sp.]|nr:hypothetical protein [Urbifossiella sp.]
MLKIIPVALIDAVIAAYPPPEAPKPPPPPAAQPGQPRAGQRVTPRADNRVPRCRAYLQKSDPAVSGEGGHDRTFWAARIIWADFVIDEADGYPLLQEFNETCQPPWSEKELRHKWDDAVAKGGERGKLLNADREGYTPRGTAPPAGDAAADRATPPTGPANPTTAPATAGMPRIVHNERQYRDVEYEAACALVAANNPPVVFVGNGGALVDLRHADPTRPPRARPLDAAALRPIFARVADWCRVVHGDDGDRTVDDFPPTPLLTSFPARSSWPGLPHLRCVVPYPVFTPTWELVAEDGYHPGSGIYCHLGGRVFPAFPDVPTPADVAEAKDLILRHVLGDFPFVDDSSRAHAVAMLLLPLVRHTIDGPTPLAVVDAPTEGTGKSLLVETCMLLTLGEVPEAMTADLKEEERDKTLTALLVEGQPIIFFDNANRKLDSGSFANTLTARRKRGRILGETRTVEAEVNVCWMLTGNNFTCSREIARRLTWCRIDAGVETPSEREDFLHPDLLEWVGNNRDRLLWALVVLVRHWRAGGAVPGSRTLGKFDRWAKTVGGILEAAGVTGFLDNAGAFRKQCADQAGELAEFVRHWAAKFGTQQVLANDLFELAREPLENVLTAETEDGKRKMLGRFLAKNRDRVVGRYAIRSPVDAGGDPKRDHSGRLLYYLAEAGKAGATVQPRAAPQAPPPSDDDEFELR